MNVDGHSSGEELETTVSEVPEKKERFTKEKLFEGMKNGKFKKICFGTGAGISVAAGIPDFRTKGIGLYHNLDRLNLPDPQALFEIDYFCSKPEAFYRFAKDSFDWRKYDATLTHHFMKLVDDKEMLHTVFTQNIDDLEIKAGFEPD